ncbi:hypothetical protein LV779_24570 [Streptomyces thinghirensis]|nr:hypothetical protein [Streptomyces thinghirensis]
MAGDDCAELDRIDQCWLRDKGRHAKELRFLVGQRNGEPAEAPPSVRRPDRRRDGRLHQLLAGLRQPLRLAARPQPAPPRLLRPA